MKAYGIPQISTGDLLRKVRVEDSDLGRKVRGIMDQGKLVDDATVLSMIRERLGQPDAAKGFILDGFPRNIAQADALTRLLAELGTPLDAVVLLELDLKVLFRRLTGRRVCEKCGRVFNIYTSPPTQKDVCDHCAGKLIQRPDDKEEVISKRLEVYEAETKPLINHYTAAGLLRVVQADADMNSVYKNIVDSVEGKLANRA
jgi:adenylate kinase